MPDTLRNPYVRFYLIYKTNLKSSYYFLYFKDKKLTLGETEQLAQGHRIESGKSQS